MKIKCFPLLLVLLVFSFNQLFAQSTYDIQFPKSEAERNQNCQSCLQIFRQKPKEVKFSIRREKNNLYFETNDKNWFNLLFKNPGDGLAVDVVAKDRYSCGVETVEPSQIKGKLLKPIYGSKLRSGLKPNDKNRFRVHVGRISDTDVNKELEYNILFLSNKYLCRYYVIYDLESYQWDLLDMGMYLDSLTYNTKQINASEKEGYILRNKTLKFTIPFEKNKSEYSQEDIKPIYDSLRLTDFNIKAINIKAYSSVEGSLKRNIELQEQRANSIVAALQAFQKPTIKTEVSSSENWVEFLNDIKGAKFESLGKLKKNQVKAKLIGALSKEMEPILQYHRKAVLELELEKKDKYKTMTPVTCKLKKHPAEMINRFFKKKPKQLSKVEYWKKWEFFELIEDLHKVERILAEFKGGYSNRFDSAQDFHSHLVNYIDDIEYGNRTDISELWIWFAPTCGWDDLVGMDGIEIGNRIFERVDNWKKHNSN